MRPAIAPARAGKGDAVTGINRADSASEKSNGPMLRQHHVDCNYSRCHGRLLSPHWQVVCLRSVSTADSGAAVASQTAYPPPHESCVRGADRAAVDKRSHGVTPETEAENFVRRLIAWAGRCSISRQSGHGQRHRSGRNSPIVQVNELNGAARCASLTSRDMMSLGGFLRR